MPVDFVCAIVVTYHPEAEVLENLRALRPQVHTLVVVDNGSSPEELAPILEAARTENPAAGFTVIENGDNLGIATALNLGIRHAFELNPPWIFLFDQDSCITESFVPSMIACFESSRWGARLATLAPRYIDRRTGRHLPARPVREGIETAMTSGSLFRLQTFREQGLFVDELFIDAVDDEYSLRLRSRGLVVDECPRATLLHAPGDPHPHGIFGRTLFHTSNYGPARRYYQERNKIWIARRYFRAHPGYTLMLFWYSAKEIVKIALGEKDKGRKLAWFLRGTFDGLREKMGPLN